MEIFQWVSADDSMAIASNPAKHAELRAELADVMIYALRLADVASIDPEEAIKDKISSNAKKYPPDERIHWSI